MSQKRSFEPYNLVRDGYNAVADSYHAQRDRWHNVDLLERFGEVVPYGGRVLDVGCGAGVPVVQRLVEAGYEVTGIDISEAMLALARQNVPNATFVCANMATYEFPEEHFDGLACCYALIHVPQEEHPQVLKKFAQTLKPAGAILLSVGRTAWEGREDFHGTEMFWSHPSPEQSCAAIRDAGFGIHMAESIPIGGEEHFWIMGRKGT